MKFNRLHLIFGVALGLTGCATMNKDECLTANWQQIGLADGASGHQISRVDEHRQACAEYGVSLDLQAYRGGYQQGLQSYCTPTNGYQVGLDGGTYYGQCPSQLHQAFLAAYQIGAKRFDINSEIRRLEWEMDSDESQLEMLKEQIDKTSRQYQIFTGTAAELRDIGYQLQQLKEQRRTRLYQYSQAQLKIQQLRLELLSLPEPKL